MSRFKQLLLENPDFVRAIAATPEYRDYMDRKRQLREYLKPYAKKAKEEMRKLMKK